MAKLVPSEFCTFHLDADETIKGYQLNEYQKMALQNELAVYANRKLELKFDPLNPQQFLQQDAELQGVIIFIKYLFAQSEESDRIQMQINSSQN